MFDITKMGLDKGTNLKEPIYFPIEGLTARTFYEYALIVVYPSKVLITKEVEKLAANVVNGGYDAYEVFKAITYKKFEFDDLGVEYKKFKSIEKTKEAIRKLTETNRTSSNDKESGRKSLESRQEDNRRERLLSAIMKAYQREDFVMEDLLANLRIKGLSVLEMAEVYAKAMYLANGDKCFIIKEDERHPMWTW